MDRLFGRGPAAAFGGCGVPACSTGGSVSSAVGCCARRRSVREFGWCVVFGSARSDGSGYGRPRTWRIHSDLVPRRTIISRRRRCVTISRSCVACWITWSMSAIRGAGAHRVLWPRAIQLLDEYNTIVHVGEHESDPRRRPLTRDELQALFDQCDRGLRAAGATAQGQSGGAARWRDVQGLATGGGCAGPSWSVWMCATCWSTRSSPVRRLRHRSVRHGKDSRGERSKRRDVLTPWSWAAVVLEQYVSEIRRCLALMSTALWLTSGAVGSPVARRRRFAELRDELGMDRMHTPHALRHSYVTHLHEEAGAPQSASLDRALRDP